MQCLAEEYQVWTWKNVQVDWTWKKYQVGLIPQISTKQSKQSQYHCLFSQSLPICNLLKVLQLEVSPLTGADFFSTYFQFCSASSLDKIQIEQNRHQSKVMPLAVKPLIMFYQFGPQLLICHFFYYESVILYTLIRRYIQETDDILSTQIKVYTNILNVQCIQFK